MKKLTILFATLLTMASAEICLLDTLVLKSNISSDKTFLITCINDTQWIVSKYGNKPEQMFGGDLVSVPLKCSCEGVEVYSGHVWETNKNIKI